MKVNRAKKLAPESLYVVVDKHGVVRHVFEDVGSAYCCADEPQYHGGSHDDEPWHVEWYKIQPPIPGQARRMRKNLRK